MENIIIEGTKKRLIDFVKYKRLSISQFQERIGVSGSYVQNIVNGIGTKVLSSICKEFPELNTEWLLYGTGDMIKETPDESIVGNKIPILPVSSIGCHLEDFVNNIDKVHCEYLSTPIDNAEFGITVTGDAMAPEFPSGSIVIVKRIDATKFIDYGRTYVLDTCNGVVLKKVFGDKDAEKIRCVSVDEKFGEYTIKRNDVYSYYIVLSCITLV